MPIFHWSDKFSVNILELDQHHQKLIGLINCLYRVKQNNNDQKLLEKVLDELVDYTKYHFKREEELMKQFEYPDYSVHKSEHDSLTQKVLDMQKKYSCGNAGIAVDIAILLNDWIAEHILVEDKKYGPYLNSKGVY